MKRSLKELKGYSIQAIDGEKGNVKDFLFDDETWIIRYLDADLGNFFKEKRVLIPKVHLGTPNWENKHFPVELTIKSIENSPDLDFDLPVSRKYEKELFEHYDLTPYWPANMVGYAGSGSMLYPGTVITPPKGVINEEDIDTNLRSYEEISGYNISAKDEQFGHINDLIIDDDTWQILYVIIDTKNIVPWSKLVMLPIELIDELSFTHNEAKINLTKDTIKNAPEYNPSIAINAEYEKVLYDFYGRKIIK